jgi:hypothetical protein
MMWNSLLRLHKRGKKVRTEQKMRDDTLSTDAADTRRHKSLLLKHGDSRQERNHSEDSRFGHSSRCRTKYRNIEQSTTGGPNSLQQGARTGYNRGPEQSTTGGPNSNRPRAERMIFQNSEGPRVTSSTKKVNTPCTKL